MHHTLVKFLAIRWLVVAAASSACLAAAPDLRLLDAVKQNDIQLANRLLKERADVNARYGDGSTALVLAAYKNNAAMADLIIRAGAGINAANDDGAIRETLPGITAAHQWLLDCWRPVQTPTQSC